MAIYDKASLVLIPSGTKTSKVYSQKPTNGDGDFTFSRSTAATRVNASGNIEKETENLLLQSNSFSTGWFGASLSVTGGHSGYDGSNDAWELNSTAGYLQKPHSSSGVQTFSVYAKQGTLEGIRLRIDAGTDANCYINLTDGSEYFANTGIDLNVTSVGGGWWRISLTANVSIVNVRFYPLSNLGSSGTGSIYIQDAQLEQGLVARDYIETTTTAIYGGITDNVPRLDYTDSSCPALLLEPQRTNLLANSEYISSSDYVLDFVTSSNNEAISPEGVQNSALISGDGSSADHALYDLQNLSVGTYTLSAFVKKNTQRYIFLAFNQLNVATYWSSSVFDLDTLAKADYSSGTYSNGTSKIEDYGNGWYRISLTASIPTATDIIPFVGLASSTSAPNTSRGRYAFTTTDSFYLYGFQLEAGSYATSYIPTYGSAVTRNADSLTLLSMSNNITSGVSAASLFMNYEYTLNSLNDAFCFGQNNNFYPAGRGYIYSTGNGFADSFGGGGFSITQGADTKTIYRLNTLSNTNIFQNGVKGSTRNGDAWAKVDQITFRGAFGTIRLKEMILFNSAISDQEAINLTTI